MYYLAYVVSEYVPMWKGPDKHKYVPLNIHAPKVTKKKVQDCTGDGKTKTKTEKHIYL